MIVIMPRISKISRKDVERAIRELELQKIRPTQARIRAALGGGSPNRISAFCREIKGLNDHGEYADIDRDLRTLTVLQTLLNGKNSRISNLERALASERSESEKWKGIAMDYRLRGEEERAARVRAEKNLASIEATFAAKPQKR
jgi:hypothetical protein